MPTNNTDNIYSTEYEDSGTPIPSTKIGYDNTVSGLEATTVQGAIDELDSKIKASDEASEITYDNTESGFEATNVQGAIDEAASIVTDIGEVIPESQVYFTGVDTTGKSFDKSLYRFVGIRAVYNQQDLEWKIIPADFAFSYPLYIAYNDGSTSASAKLAYENGVVKCQVYNTFTSVHVYGIK